MLITNEVNKSWDLLNNILAIFHFRSIILLLKQPNLTYAVNKIATDFDLCTENQAIIKNF